MTEIECAPGVEDPAPPEIARSLALQLGIRGHPRGSINQPGLLHGAALPISGYSVPL